MPPASAFSLVWRLAGSGQCWAVLDLRLRFLLFGVGLKAERMTAAVRWMTSGLSASSAALPWYRWM